eukprot:COSAG02_NODE_59619_length_273_cov_79.787356_1_plen_34_part_01
MADTVRYGSTAVVLCCEEDRAMRACVERGGMLLA